MEIIHNNVCSYLLVFGSINFLHFVAPYKKKKKKNLKRKTKLYSFYFIFYSFFLTFFLILKKKRLHFRAVFCTAHTRHSTIY